MDTLTAILNGIGRIFAAMFGGAVDAETPAGPAPARDGFELELKRYKEIDPRF